MEKYSARARRHIVERGRSVALRRDYATPHLAYKPSYAVRRRVEASLDSPASTVYCWNRWVLYWRHIVERDRTMPRRAEGPRDAIWCRETTCSYSMQIRRAEGPRDAVWCRVTACSYSVQRDRATLYGAERPRVATACRGTARRCMVQRDRV